MFQLADDIDSSLPGFFHCPAIHDPPGKAGDIRRSTGELEARAVGSIGVHRANDDVLAPRDFQGGREGELLVPSADPLLLAHGYHQFPAGEEGTGRFEGLAPSFYGVGHGSHVNPRLAGFDLDQLIRHNMRFESESVGFFHGGQ